MSDLSEKLDGLVRILCDVAAEEVEELLAAESKPSLKELIAAATAIKALSEKVSKSETGDEPEDDGPGLEDARKAVNAARKEAEK